MTQEPEYEAPEEAEWAEYEEEWEEYADAEPDHDPVLVRTDALSGVRDWLFTAMRGLLDIRFRRVSTRTLLPVVYVLFLLMSIAVPVALSVAVFQFSVFLGVLFLVFVAPLLALSMAATVRLLLEFLISINRLGSKVTHMSQLADDIHTSLNEVAVPMSQLSEDVRAVQFWRFKKR
ncbi:DUF4282 domain-containing protein [Antrihabitans cavernicola]|uniref:DUF4282 domain-containing protein n=1 Tax=Antrihabitans cavernicola TaxID=2495913 RepID=A0A5A7SJM3_9NOCA|nr:DUF4282 domain-containing protein [Spelaeibacter cavernicola]KAA0024625.1 DUF4282 domain-containing protein [Spelaeibacter cavernicola]